MIGPSDPAWDDVVVTATSVVVQWATDGQFRYYSDLADAVNALVGDAELEAHGHPMNRLLFDVVMTARSFDEYTPVLSAVVVLKDPNNRQPGPGFWQLAEELGLYNGSSDDGDRAAFWGEEFARCASYWTRARRREFERWLRAHGPTLFE